MSTETMRDDDVSTAFLSVVYQIYLACGFLCGLAGAGAVLFGAGLAVKGDSDGWRLMGIGLGAAVAGLTQMGLGEAAKVLIALEKRTRRL